MGRQGHTEKGEIGDKGQQSLFSFFKSVRVPC